MKGLRNRLKIVAVVLIILGVWASTASADARQFIPKILDYRGFLALESSYESHDDTDGRRLYKDDLFVREKLTLSTLGYVFHPRFILFTLELSGGLKQEKVSGNIQNSPLRTMGSAEYDFRMSVLPKHPYNLELFTRRLEPLVKGLLSPDFQSVAYASGAIFRYKKKPYFLDVHYLYNSVESASADYTTQKYGLLGTFYKELVGGNNYSFNVAYDHRKSESPDATGSSDEISAGNSIFYRKLRLSSGVSYYRFDQSAFRGASSSGKNFNWTERSNLDLPWNFSADLSYVLAKSWLDFGEATAEETKLTNTVNNASFSISHKLYQSLISTYRFGYTSSKSDAGENTSISNSLGFNYAKNIPWGILRAQFSIGHINIDGTGALDVVNEQHAGQQVPFGRFMLDGRNVTSESIIIFLQSPFVPGELVLMRQNVDYIVTAVGDATQIDLLSLPSGFPVPGTYDFVVSYSARQKTGVTMKNLNSAVSLELFGEMIVPYWTHDVSEETTEDSFSGGEPLNSTIDTFGIKFRKRPFTVTTQYHIVSSNVNPSKGWRAQVNYLNDIFANTQLDTTVIYSSTSYDEETSRGEVVPGYTETQFALSAGVRQRIPKRNLYLYVGGTYNTQKGLGESTTYALNSNVSWIAGKISVEAGAAVSFSDSETAGTTTRRTDQYYYLSVKRRLF